MLGTVEELEKEIDEFQNNIAASGEMVMALKQMTEQIKQQNSEFDMQSKALLSRLDTLPASVENTTIANNERVRSDIAAELNKSLKMFSEEQEKYIASLKGIQNTIQMLSDAAKEQENLFDEKTVVMADKIELTLKQLTEEIEKTTSDLKADMQKNNEAIKGDVEVVILERVKEVTETQKKYMEEIASVQDSIKKCEERVEHKYEAFLSDLGKVQETLKQDISTVVTECNKEVIDAQANYIEELENVSASMRKCEESLDNKYNDFISSLEKMNIANLYEQNKYLESELSKRTTILMIISVVSVVLGLAGLFI